MCVGYIPVHTGLPMMTVGDTENLSVNFVFLKTTPSESTFIDFSVNI